MNRHSLLSGRAEPRRRLRLDVTGAVQGVGFRPFVHRLAVSEGLAGFVRNTGAGVSLEVEGSVQAIDRFVARLDGEIRPPADIHARQAALASAARRAGLRDFAKHVHRPALRRGAA